MAIRFVDETLPYQVAYSLFHHEYLGFLISVHLVQILPDGQLGMAHQGLHPENLEPYLDHLDPKDQELIHLASELQPWHIIRKFGGDPREDFAFFTRKYQGQVRDLGAKYIEKRLVKILPQLVDRNFYEMGGDSYPAGKPLKVISDKATVLFHFRRREDHTKYFPTIKLRDEKIEFRSGLLICESPAWMLLEGEVFTFAKSIEGSKLKPFLRKSFIRIPKEKEEEYYRKFVTRLVEKYDVYAKGFVIDTVRENPRFSLVIQDQGTQSLSFRQQVSYGRFTIPVNGDHDCKAVLEREGASYRFFRILRHTDAEKKLREDLKLIEPGNGTLTPWECIPRDKGLRWISDHAENLKKNGIRLIQEGGESTLNLTRPELHIETQEDGDWFDLHAVVQVGQFKIPFAKFRKYILKGKREFPLPDGSVAILPESWFLDYRHLMEVSGQTDPESLRIHRSHAPLLQIPGNNSFTAGLQSLASEKGIPRMESPEGLKAELRNYQMRGFEWLHFMKGHKMGGILADDMGLGKTLQTLALLQHEKETGAQSAPSLIVMPTSLIHNWEREAARFTPGLKVFVHTGINRQKEHAVFKGKDLILSTYGIVRQDIDFLKTFCFHYIVLDESQMVKNPGSKTAQAVRQLSASHRLSLTGTPIENTIMDLWSQMSFLNPGLLGSEAFFKNFYVTPVEKLKDPARTSKLRKIVYPFILRRKKQQVEKELPPRIEQIYYCEMEEVQEKLYEDTRNAYRNYLLNWIDNGELRKNKLNLLAGLQRLRQIAIHPRMVEENVDMADSGKFHEVIRLLKNVIGRRSKILVFSQFVKMLTLVRGELDRQKIAYCYLDGSTRDRKEQVERFQTDKKIPVFLISLKAGGLGLNLTAADYVFILDPWWNPAAENQAIDRAHRIGQTKPVFYYKFITAGTIEEKILRLQERKLQLSNDIITVEEDIYKSLTEEDLKALLED